MIYQTPAVVLAAAPASANNPWVGYHTVLLETNVTSDEAAATFPVSNIANRSTAEKWKGTSTAIQGVVINEGALAECDYFGLCKHNFGSTGATIKLQASPDGADYTDVTEAVAPGTDNAIMFRFAPQTAAYWRLLITPGSAAPQITVMFLGKLLVLQRSIYVGHTPLTLGRSQNVTVGRSEGGQFLGLYLRSQTLQSSVDLKNLTPGWYRTLFDPFAESMASKTFFWSWRPDSYPDEVGYAWSKGGANVSNQSPNGLMQASFSMEGVR